VARHSASLRVDVLRVCAAPRTRVVGVEEVERLTDLLDLLIGESRLLGPRVVAV
jgi:hypothetical protein